MRQQLRATVIFLLAATLSFSSGTPRSQADIPPSCDSEIYCQGDLLHQVQTSKIFPDSKTFVDLRLKSSKDDILTKFDALKKKYPKNIPNEKLKAFVDQYFIDCGDDPSCKELVAWNPKDWSENPSFLDKIKDPNYKKWASDLHNIWKKLARIMDPQVKEDSNSTSLIYVPNGFIIPGGRFREMYYWDTFWVIKGLLTSGMTETVKGIINNFLSLVERLGHIPNGSRVYYMQRSQPPLLIHMIRAYVEKTGDKTIIKDSLALLGRELEYFTSNRQVEVKKDGESYKMYRYFAVSSGPRPESYREDFQHAQSKKTDAEKTKFYVNMKSGAESGWDFSSRWFIKNKGNEGTILDIDTQDIIPVDLNAFLHQNFKLLASWNKEFGPASRAEYFSGLEKGLLNAMKKVLWDENDGIWYDYDNLNGVPRKYFYLSNFAPLLTRSYDSDLRNLTTNILKYIEKADLRKYIGGTPSSLTYSGEQWDYPNAWPPLQSFIIQGLDRLGTYRAQEAAYHLANQWLKSNYKGYVKYGKMFEKYNALELGEPGSGGEYADQEGFGWTNGLVLQLLERYGDVLVSDAAKGYESYLQANILHPEVELSGYK